MGLSINQDYFINPEAIVKKPAILIVPVTGQGDLNTEGTFPKQPPRPAVALGIK